MDYSTHGTFRRMRVNPMAAPQKDAGALLERVDPITSFSGSYGFLSNFHKRPFRMHGVVFRTSEHAYQAWKVLLDDDREKVIQADTPGKAKKIANNCLRRPEWEAIKVSVMMAVLMQKFQDDALAKKLVETGQRQLVEGNTWGDTFWGVCNGKGKNTLGVLLMAVRAHCIAQR